MADSKAKVYHERQSWKFCAIHAVNNLLQKCEFKKADFDKIARALAPGTWLNPHKSPLGIGNYDISVLTMALQSKNMGVQWFDRRRSPRTINLDGVPGLIVNTERPGILFGKRNHWFALRKFDGKWTNVDSILEEPKVLGGEDELVEFLNCVLKEKNAQVFIVCSDLDTDGAYRKEAKKAKDKQSVAVAAGDSATEDGDKATGQGDSSVAALAAGVAKLKVDGEP